MSVEEGESGETKEWKSGRVEENEEGFIPPFFHSSILPLGGGEER
jgi:hypothetical protein